MRDRSGVSAAAYEISGRSSRCGPPALILIHIHFLLPSGLIELTLIALLLSPSDARHLVEVAVEAKNLLNLKPVHEVDMMAVGKAQATFTI